MRPLLRSVRLLPQGELPGLPRERQGHVVQDKACCGDHGHATCADCKDFTDPDDCRKFNNLIAKVIGVVVNSSRRACVLKIRELGIAEFASFMAGSRRQTLPRRGA
jgi:hypothetical protein